MTRRAVIFGCAGPQLSADEAAFFRQSDPFGFILFGRNVVDPAQLSALTAALRDAVGWAAPILIDQEGGRVQRMGAPHWRTWMPPMDQMARVAAGSARRAMYLRGRLIAADLNAVGIDTNCAPLADVAQPDTHPFLRNRCCASAPDLVASMGRALSDGMRDGGVVSVVKHLPGHGRGRVDSHLDLPTVAASADDLRAVDFAAFKPLADLPMGMTAHVVYSDLDAAAPATQSAAMIRCIRNEIGFGGLLMTDDIGMEALKGTAPDRAVRSLAAGCDVVLHCNGYLPEMHAVAAAVPRLDGPAAKRADTALAHRQPADGADLAALDAEFGRLVSSEG